MGTNILSKSSSLTTHFGPVKCNYSSVAGKLKNTVIYTPLLMPYVKDSYINGRYQLEALHSTAST